MEIFCSPAIGTSQQYVVTFVKRRYGIHHITTFTQGMFKPVQKRLCNLAVGQGIMGLWNYEIMEL